MRLVCIPVLCCAFWCSGSACGTSAPASAAQVTVSLTLDRPVHVDINSGQAACYLASGLSGYTRGYTGRSVGWPSGIGDYSLSPEASAPGASGNPSRW
jgi:hypothetical protein